MEYYVHAVARTHSFYDDIVVKLPIVIVGDKVDMQMEIDLFENGMTLCRSRVPSRRRTMMHLQKMWRITMVMMFS